MKIKTMVLACLAVAIVLFIVYEYSFAQAKPDALSSKIAVVRIRKVFRDCKKNAKYRAEALAEQSKTNADEAELSKTIDATEAGLKALKPGSADYMAQAKELFDKQGALKAMQEFNKRRSMLRDQLWTEELYKDSLDIIKELAEKKGLALVLEMDEPEFPVRSGDELMMSLQTHKVLYGAGCVDLTADVVSRLDQASDAKK